MEIASFSATSGSVGDRMNIEGTAKSQIFPRMFTITLRKKLILAADIIASNIMITSKKCAFGDAPSQTAVHFDWYWAGRHPISWSCSISKWRLVFRRRAEDRGTQARTKIIGCDLY